MTTGRVKSALIADPVTKAHQIDVETFKGTVQLNGFVDTAASKERATEVAKSTKGVTAVRNNLTVKTTERSGEQVVDDGAITAKVKSALAGDPRTKAHQINVETREGAVQLSGFVDNSEAKSTAEELARAVDHVKIGRQRARRQEISSIARTRNPGEQRGRSGDTPAPFCFGLQESAPRSDSGAGRGGTVCIHRGYRGLPATGDLMKPENRIERFTTHWQSTFKDEPYYSEKYSWDDFDPAYRYAYKSYEENPNARFEDLETRLEAGWDIAKGKSKLAWVDAKQAIVRPGTASSVCCPGDADRDGR